MGNLKESKHVRRFRELHLKSGEKMVAWGDGYIGNVMGVKEEAQKNGSLIVSNERVIFYRRGLLGEVLETIPLKSITSIERRSTLGHRVIRIHTSHDRLEFKLFDKAIEQALMDAIEAGRGAETKQAAGIDGVEMLQKLAQLRDAGVVTEQEFQDKKRDLLNRL